MDGTASRSRLPGGRFRASAVFCRWVVAGVLATSVASAPVPASAQIRVEGEILDAVTDLPVSGVIIHLPDLNLGTISDEFGYFVLDAIPRGVQVVSAHRAGYEAIEQEVRVVPGEVWEVRLTPAAIPVRGIEVTAATSQELEVARTGRRSDFISPSTVAEAAERTNKVLEVLRSKAPPRLRIRQEGGIGGVTFCIESSRRRPSVQELFDVGDGCRPTLLALDGVIIYSPPSMTLAGMQAPSLPSDVAAMLLNQNPQEIRSIRVLSPADAFFRYGEAGRSGAVEIVTVHPGRPKGS